MLVSVKSRMFFDGCTVNTIMNLHLYPSSVDFPLGSLC